ncbi:hypothetical protein [Caballeronia choica]|nr:hypothetical protein [Caballeronia choica]
MLAALAEVMLECIGTDGIEDIPLKQRLHEQERVRRAMRDASGDAAAFDYAYNATRAGAVQEMVEQEIQKE